jgi:hypothetical protein
MYQARPTRSITAVVTPIPMPTIAPVDMPSFVNRSAAGGLDPVVERASPLLVVTEGELDNAEVDVEDMVLLLISAIALVMLKILVAESVTTVFSSQTPIANI